MFERPHHIRIATVLQALNAELLAEQNCLFGGGTAMALSHGEYRESVDIDFMISNRKGFQVLRSLLTGPRGIGSIVRSGMELAMSTELRADQYGIRTMLLSANIEIKFEIVLEARFELEEPDAEDRICGVSTLTRVDMAASKFLANCDRWSDDSVFSRDLIDLAMLNLPKKMFVQALEKSFEAYGASVERDLMKSIEKLENRPGRLEECMVALKIDDIPKALLWKRIRNLKKLRLDG